MSFGWVERFWGVGGARLLAGDLAVIAVLSCATGALFAARGERGAVDAAEVRVAGRVLPDIDLARNGVVEVAGPLGITRIEVRDRRVRVLSSPCPRQLCRHSGWIDAAGDLLVCVPNETVVRLPGRRSGVPDAVSR